MNGLEYICVSEGSVDVYQTGGLQKSGTQGQGQKFLCVSRRSELQCTLRVKWIATLM
jgi:hypothetical protein